MSANNQKQMALKEKIRISQNVNPSFVVKNKI
jgi:hypothetical protein